MMRFMHAGLTCLPLHQALEASERQAVKLDELLSTAIKRGDDLKASLDEANAQCKEKNRSAEISH